ncbi:MAG TPA: MarR family transcriptional regulator [Solirubrobacteraceae bacterium]
MGPKDQRPESIVLLMQRAAHVTLAALASRLGHLGLTPGEINVLANLADGEQRTVSELSRQVGTPLTTMTSLLDRLKRRELITRRTPESNRRTVVIGLTRSGRRVASEALAAVAAVEGELAADMSAGQLRQLRRALEAAGRTAFSAHR